MKKIKFNCNGHNAPAYRCSEPGDNSGEYYRVEEVEPFLTVLGKILEAHKMSYVDWLAIHEATRLLKNHNNKNNLFEMD